MNGGFTENYFSWLWGNSLFVTLDVYLYSSGAGQGWDFTLGIMQYLWLGKVLETPATFKFVFHHHINGVSRGGVEIVNFFEWGGYATDGHSYQWPSYRPASQGWTIPINQLFLKNNVSISFQGHDHLFVKQGWPSDSAVQIVYVTLPFPAFPDPSNFFGTQYDNSDAFTTPGSII